MMLKIQFLVSKTTCHTGGGKHEGVQKTVRACLGISGMKGNEGY
jgi:hypothetical protein